MTTVFLYQGEGTFSEARTFDWNSPAAGNRHKFILFLSQESAAPEQKLALEKVAEYGFTEVELGEGRPIVVESTNEPKMQVFSRYYEGALREGNSLVWYP
jgi:hypothetical protein